MNKLEILAKDLTTDEAVAKFKIKGGKGIFICTILMKDGTKSIIRSTYNKDGETELLDISKLTKHERMNKIENLKAIDFTQSEIAFFLQISQASVSNYLSGKSKSKK